MFHPKMSAYRRDFDETKYMSFLIKYDILLKKYNKILKRVKNTIDRKFDRDPVYNENNLKAKINTRRRFSMYLLINNFDQFFF